MTFFAQRIHVAFFPQCNFNHMREAMTKLASLLEQNLHKLVKARFFLFESLICSDAKFNTI